MELTESIYNIRVPLHRGRRLLFNTLSRSLCLLEAADVDILDDILHHGTAPHPVVDQLFAQGFVLPSSVDEISVVQRRYEAQRHDPGAVTLTVCPTLSCNFGCDYCFQGADKPIETMSAEVQDGVVALYERLLECLPQLRTLRSMWYGGEPLLRPKVIYGLADRLIAICKKRGIDYSGSMISNGSQMTREVAEQLYARGLRSVQITLDGDRADHDARRHYLSRKGSYDTIIANVQQWVYDIPIQIDLRVNIDVRNQARIRALIDDLVAAGLSRLPNLKMYFAPVESVTMGCHSVTDKMIKKLEFGQLEVSLLRYAFEHGLTDLPYVPQFMGICSALKPFDFIVVPTGDVHKCWDTVSFADKRIGSVSDIDALFDDKSLLQEQWDNFNPFDHATCRSCKILPNCSSFCAHKFIHATDARGEAALPCPSLKYSINEKILLRAEKEGYITAADYDPHEARTQPTALCAEGYIPASEPLAHLIKIKLPHHRGQVVRSG